MVARSGVSGWGVGEIGEVIQKVKKKRIKVDPTVKKRHIWQNVNFASTSQ